MKTAKRSFNPFHQVPWPRTLRTAVLTLLGFTAYGEAKQPATPQDVSLPARAAFYYPWFPETWAVNGTEVSALPVLDYYSSDDVAVIEAHIKALAHAKIEVAIASWWGVGTHYEQERIPKLLEQTRGLGSPLKWTFYYEKEGQGDPSVSELQADLDYLRQAYFGPTSAVLDGKPVIFVYNADDVGCEVAERWRAAAADWYVVLKVFPGYRDCAAQPSSWHQYGPAEAADQQVGFSYSISPGFWRADEPAPRLPRNLDRWRQNIREMVAAGDPWQLVTTFNEWGEGTAVEEAAAWENGSYGVYLDALASDGAEGEAAALTPSSSVEGTVTVAAVGDIACDPVSESFEGGEGTPDNCRHQYVANLIAQGGADVFLPLGDIQYEEGTPEQFSRSYEPSFGRYLDITYPVVGNHEYLTADAAGYYGYFGERAGDPEKGYYSFDLGAWHVVALNSNCSEVGGCEPGSPQEQWLRADLAANPSRCTLAYMHHPRFSSGDHGNNSELEAFWDALYDFGTEVVLSGHDHIYERFAPQTADGLPDPEGVRQFVVGTGGKNHTEIGEVQPNSELRHSGTYGLLELALGADRYRWTFVPEAGQLFTDSGSLNCHG